MIKLCLGKALTGPSSESIAKPVGAWRASARRRRRAYLEDLPNALSSGHEHRPSPRTLPRQHRTPLTAFGLGGYGVLRTHGKDEEALAVIAAAVERGVTYFDSARAYAGPEGFLTAVVPEARRRKTGVIGMKALGQGASTTAHFIR